MAGSPELFLLRPVASPWGDYGRVLAQGMSYHLDRHQGLIQLERTGPTIFPITFPGAGDIVVTDAFRAALESSGLTGFTFQPVIKRHIVEVDWESWDATADGPQEYPENRIAENYLIGHEHETLTADELGILWELCPRDGIDVTREDGGVRLRPETWNGADFFRARTTGIVGVSRKARDWLEHHAGDYVEFEAFASGAA